MNGADTCFEHVCEICRTTIGYFSGHDSSQKAKQIYCDTCLETDTPRLKRILDDRLKSGDCIKCSRPHDPKDTCERMWQVLTSMHGLRFTLLKMMFPEIIKVASILRAYYWYSDTAEDTAEEIR